MPHSLEPDERFDFRHIGPQPSDLPKMLEVVGAKSLDELIAETVPRAIRLARPLSLPEARSEAMVLAALEEKAAKNRVLRSFIGAGYYGTHTPPVILRNILENPGWYTQYTPYQAEISQGRLEALLNFQTMVSDLTGLPIANASLLDESTAVAEAAHLMRSAVGNDARSTLLVDERCHPQTLEVIKTRAWASGYAVEVGDAITTAIGPRHFGVVVQYPDTEGRITDIEPMIATAHAAGALVCVATDLLALTLLTPPGELGADIAVGSTQRFGVPMGYGGPHAAFFATTKDQVRRLPGRIIGLSKDAHGKPALRMALQTREQHIRREKATSNVCTAQALLAIMAGMFAVYHGPDGLRAIAERCHRRTRKLSENLQGIGLGVEHRQYFDTLVIRADAARCERLHATAVRAGYNLRHLSADRIGISLDETTTDEDVRLLTEALSEGANSATVQPLGEGIPEGLKRASTYLTHPVFHAYRCETEMLRYIRMLESRDLSLTRSMIPLGSCTMKLNATAEMMPLSLRGFSGMHPFAPRDQAAGYAELVSELEGWLCEITGFARGSLQPNAGSQGEYAGLLVIRKYHETRGEGHRNVCLIPASAHGTNPASAAMAGFDVVVVACDERGNVSLDDLKRQAAAHRDTLAALMITYPSTHGVFEEAIAEICAVIHDHGGQVYLDGANMNAQVGLCRPGDFGADVCHLNLHKTFAIPHGGGGPGVGPIFVSSHLAPFLPTHPLADVGGQDGIGPVSAAPYGSASILTISWAYIALLGPVGLTRATMFAILNANYVAARTHGAFPVVYRGAHGRVAHECILDVRPVKKSSSIDVVDVAKRLMDYGFHAPTMSFPIPGTLMVEPTESESLYELDRLCDALLAIRAEIAEVEAGTVSAEACVVRHAPFTAEAVLSEPWPHPFTRARAAFPTEAVRRNKFWPFVGRIQDAYGDRNLVCSCPPVESYR